MAEGDFSDTLPRASLRSRGLNQTLPQMERVTHVIDFPQDELVVAVPPSPRPRGTPAQRVKLSPALTSILAHEHLTATTSSTQLQQAKNKNTQEMEHIEEVSQEQERSFKHTKPLKNNKQKTKEKSSKYRPCCPRDGSRMSALYDATSLDTSSICLKTVTS